MIDAEQLKKNIIRDMRVELSEEFDKNFERKAFFTKKWKKRADPDAKGSLLLVTGTLRRSIKAEERPNGVRFSSAVPYAQIHNEGGKVKKSNGSAGGGTVGLCDAGHGIFVSTIARNGFKRGQTFL